MYVLKLAKCISRSVLYAAEESVSRIELDIPSSDGERGAVSIANRRFIWANKDGKSVEGDSMM